MDKLKKYKHIFFDLDHTLWDYEKNSTEVLNELVLKHKLIEMGIPSIAEFFKTFEEVNTGLWSDFNKNKISRTAIREQRFLKILANYQIENLALCNRLSDEYLMQCPTKPHVFPFTFEVLDYLKEKYHLHILTNGFDDVQYIKLEKSKLTPYFKTVVTSDSAGFKKPMASIFKFAIDKAEEVRALIDSVYERTLKLLTDKKKELGILAEQLLEKEILFQSDLEKLIGKRPFAEDTTYEAFTKNGKMSVADSEKKEDSKSEEEALTEESNNPDSNSGTDEKK